MSRQDLFPPIEPYATGMLKLDALHTIYWEQSGNPHGTAVAFLHGGPGAGATPTHRRFFDPQHYRIVIFDQRGIERWAVFGGSWGSTLALAYAETHPTRCIGLVLRGIFLCRRSEVDWFLYGIRSVFPEAWRAFAGFVPEGERGDLLTAYYRRLTDPDPAVHMPAARAWSTYEGACSTLLPSPDTVAAFGEDRMALGLARIEAHYFRHNVIAPEDDLIGQIHRIRHIPAIIVQGRYDMVCPIVSADELARAWPEAEYLVVPDAGHSAMEPGIRARLVGATEKLRRIL